MYNIDLSFLHSKEIESLSENPEQKYNEVLKHKIASSICPILSKDLECMGCELPDMTSTTKVDERTIIEVNCRGLMGHNFCLVDANVDFIEKYDLVIIQLDDCVEIATVDEVGEIVQARRQRFGLSGEKLPVALRKANEEDLEKYRINLNDEVKARPVFREKVEKFSLNMKLVDIHYQFDRKRLFFFYTSDGRVDFRELAKELAGVFKTRIELRQIGVRDEAKRIGGLGSCGREYCCTAFLQNFKKITTQIANDQNVSSNLSKMSGPCGKLKCCLSFEIDEN